MMKRPGYLILASAAFCLGCAVFFGCSAPPDTSDEGLFPVKKSGAAAELLKEIKYDGEGTLRGRVTYDGDPPPRPDIAAIAINQDRPVCAQGDVHEQTWMVDSNRGVANVVVYIKVPKGSFFKKPDDKAKMWKDEVVVDQPFCQFIPHVVTLYPEYYDGTRYQKTGQALKVLNSSLIGHDIKVAGSNDLNPAKGSTLSAKTGQYLFPDVHFDKRELTLNCNIHKWMAGYALTFDHPYSVVTAADGTFEIKHVPAGVELTIKGWHEELKHFDPTAGGTKVTLKPGESKELNFSVKKK